MGNDRLPLHMRLGESYLIRIYRDDVDNDAIVAEFPPQVDLPPEIDFDLIEFSSDDDTSEDEDEGSVNYPMSMIDGIETVEEPQGSPSPDGDPEDISNNTPGSVTEPAAGPSTDATPGQNQETSAVAVRDAQQPDASNNPDDGVLPESTAVISQLRGTFGYSEFHIDQN